MGSLKRSIGYCRRAGYSGGPNEHDYFIECPICFALTVPAKANAHERQHNQKEN